MDPVTSLNILQVSKETQCHIGPIVRQSSTLEGLKLRAWNLSWDLKNQ